MTPGTLLLGRYRVLEQLGSGGYGVVLGVLDESLQRRIALKILHGSRQGSARDVSRFFREAEACSRLTSLHVARLYHADESPEIGPFMAMEWLRGADLGEVLRREGPLPAVLAIRHVLEAASALAEAHALGIVHRDLKPTNLFRAHEGSHVVTKVLDFGMAKTVDDAAQLTASGALAGTPRYMAPEQLTAPQQADHRVDIWALGVVLFELLSGQSPYLIDESRGIVGYLMRGPSIPLRRVCPSAPPGLEHVLARCLSAQPAERPAHMGELAVALAPFAGPHAAPLVESVLGHRAPMLRPAGAMQGLPSVQPPTHVTPRARGPVWALLLPLVVLAALVVGAGFLWSSLHKSAPLDASDSAMRDAAPAVRVDASATDRSDASAVRVDARPQSLATPTAPTHAPSGPPGTAVPPIKPTPSARRDARDTAKSCASDAQCARDNEFCSPKTSTCKCNDGRVYCGGACVRSSREHCEDCTPCGERDECLQLPGSDFFLCSATCKARNLTPCDGYCANLSSIGHCGRCFNMCGPGQHCLDRQCVNGTQMNGTQIEIR